MKRLLVPIVALSLAGCGGGASPSLHIIPTHDPEPKLSERGYTVNSTGQLYALCNSALNEHTETDIGNTACGMYLQGFISGIDEFRRVQGDVKFSDRENKDILRLCDQGEANISRVISGYVGPASRSKVYSEHGSYIPAKSSLLEFLLYDGSNCGENDR